MPVYEFYCSDCRTKFEALKSMASLDEAQQCANCGGSKHVNRTISTFARGGRGIEAFGGSESGGAASMPLGGGCCGGGCGCQ